jgi:hypothetical protein
MPNESTSPEKHYTREPWWVVLVAAAIMAVVPLWKYQSIQRINTIGLSLPVVMCVSAALGAAAAIPLVIRSHVNSPFWSNVALTGGILLIAIGVCILCHLLSA